jgi:hypothetical protein
MTPVIVGSGVSVMTAEADFAGFATLVAVTVTDVPVDGAVRTPAEVMDPPEVVKVTAFEMVPVLATVGVQVVLLPSTRVVAWHTSERPVMAAAGVSEMLSEPDFVGSVTLVAVTVSAVACVLKGAVSTPVVLIVPSEVDQVTAEE